MRLTIASWNILNDWAVPKHVAQRDRVSDIAETINHIKQGSGTFVIFLCECETIKNINSIASKSGLVVVGEPIRYREREEYFCFLADEATARESQAQPTIIDQDPCAILTLNTHKLTIVGCHMPWEFIRKFWLRKKYTGKLLEIKPDIFLGDFNAPPSFLMRRHFKQAGYTETHAKNRPSFPTKFYRGVNNPKWMPDISLDAIYHKPEILADDAQHSISTASDHPIIWADFNVND